MSANRGLALTPIAAAISAVLAPTGLVQAQEDGSSSSSIEEIVVTSRKREENLQDIPASIQAIPQIMLEKMGANGIEDYTRFIPSVNVVSYTPGSSDIIFRGINSGSIGTGQAPASLYFDELPLTTTGDQPEVRMVDINRIEALAGPQGTLYGGSAQAGTLRVITNEPDVTQFEGIGSLTLKTGSESATSHEVTGVLNLPFGDGKAALRLVGFTARDGGFIDNVYGHTPDTHATSGWIPATWGVEDNADVVEDDWNGVDFNGGRVALKVDFNDTWTGTLGYNYQKTEADAGTGNHYDPFVGDLQVVKFNDGFRNQDWDAWNLTFEGDLGWAQLVSATSFFETTAETTEDATVYIKNYQRWACLYQWDPAVYTGYFVDPSTGAALYYPRYCFGNTSLDDVEQVQHFSQSKDKFAQEIRLSGGDDDMNWIVGLFYETTNDDWNSPWGDPTNFDYQDSVALAYWESTFGTGFAPEAQWGWESISLVKWEQKAVFGEMTWNINDQWSTTLGGRYFDRQMDSEYLVENPNTVISTPDLIAQGGPSFTKGGSKEFVPKISFSYSPSDDKMMYVLYSEGFRPGGTNRGRGNPVLPVVFDADKLENFEVGAKTRWMEGRLQVNLTYYDMGWKDYQLRVLDPSYGAPVAPGEPPNPWQQVIANVGDAQATGLQVEVDFAASELVTVGMNVVTQDSKTATDVSTDTNPATIEIPANTRLPLAVEFKASGWIDVNWETNFIQGQAFARLQVSHTGDSVNQIAPSSTGADPQYINEPYTIADLRFGLITDSEWQFDVFVSNITDERAQYNQGGYSELLFSSVQDGRTNWSRVWTNRPREYGLKISKRWGE
jgi:iron complex outermembrane receptor protein